MILEVSKSTGKHEPGWSFRSVKGKISPLKIQSGEPSTVCVVGEFTAHKQQRTFLTSLKTLEQIMCFSCWLCQTGSSCPSSSVLPTQIRSWQTTWGLNSGPETSMPPSKHEIPGDGLLASLESQAVKPTLSQNTCPCVWMCIKTVAGPGVQNQTSWRYRSCSSC